MRRLSQGCRKLDTHKSMGLDGLALTVQQKLANVIATTDTLKGRAATHRDLHRLEKSASENLTKFNTSKCEPCTWQGLTWYDGTGESTSWLGSSSEERDLGSQEQQDAHDLAGHPCSEKAKWYKQGSCRQVDRNYSSCLLSTHHPHPQICAVLGLSVQERY